MAVNQSTINILKQYSGGRELRFSQPTIIINNNTQNVVNNQVDATEKPDITQQDIKEKSSELNELNRVVNANLLNKNQIYRARNSEFKRVGESINRFFTGSFKGFTETVKDIAKSLNPKNTLDALFGGTKSVFWKIGFFAIMKNWDKVLISIANIEKGFNKLASFVTGKDEKGKKVSRLSLSIELFNWVGLKQIPEFIGNVADKVKSGANSLMRAFEILFSSTKKGTKSIVNGVETLFLNFFNDRKKALELLPKLDLMSTGGDVEQIALKLVEYFGNVVKALFGGTDATFDIVASSLKQTGRESSMMINDQIVDSGKEDLSREFDSNTSMGDFSIVYSNKRGTYSTDYDSSGNLVNSTSATFRQSTAITDMIDINPDRFVGESKDFKDYATTVPVSGFLGSLSTLENAVEKDEKETGGEGVMVSEDFLDSMGKLAGINLKALAKKKDYEFRREAKSKEDIRLEGGDAEYETDKAVRREVMNYASKGLTESWGRKALKWLSGNAGTIIGGIIGACFSFGLGTGIGAALGNMIQRGIEAAIGIKAEDAVGGYMAYSNIRDAQDNANEVNKMMKKNKLVLRPYTGKGVPITLAVSEAKTKKIVAQTTKNKFTFWTINKDVMNKLKAALSKKIGMDIQLDQKKDKLKYLHTLRKATSFLIEQRKARLKELAGKYREARNIDFDNITADYSLDDIDNFIQALEEKEIYNKLGEADILEGLQDIGIGFQGAVGTIKEYLSRVPKTLKVVGAHNGGGRGLPWRIVQGYNKETMPDLVRKYGIPVRITSGYRGYNTASGDNSWHRAKDNFGNPAAYDIVPLDRNYNNLLKWIFSRPAVVKEFLDRGWGILDESTRENIKKKRTGATGFHFHVGPDSLSKKEFLGAMKAYNPTMFYQYIKDGSVSNSYMDSIEECSRKILSQVKTWESEAMVYAYAASQRNNSKKVNKSVTNKKVKA